jgi:hypothetical protein
MLPSNDSDDKPPQNGFQEKRHGRKRRRSGPLSAVMKLNPYVAVTVSVTVALTLAVTVQFVIHLSNSLNCNGLQNHCGPIIINRNVYIPGGRPAQPQPSPSPPIGSPRQPSDQAPLPSPQNLFSPPLVGTTPTSETETWIPAQPVPSQPIPEPVSRQPKNQYPQPPESYSDKPKNDADPPMISYSIPPTAEPKLPEPPPTQNPTTSQPQSPQTSILDQLLPNNNNTGIEGDPGIPEPPATTGILAIMGFLGWITRRMQPKDPEE